MSIGAGAGYNMPDIDRTVASLAQGSLKLCAQAADLRKWLERVAPNGEADKKAAAAALAGKVNADGQSLDPDKALLIVNAIYEMTWWANSFAPTYTLDVRGPSSLI